MVERIIAGVAHALTGAFGEGYPVYANRVGQGLSPPCFSVTLLSREEKRMPGRRTRHTLPFDILYFPVDAEKRVAIWEIERRMREAVSMISVDGELLRGNGLKSEQIDGVLHVYVRYGYFSVAPDDTEMMGSCRSDFRTKGAGR